MHSQLRHLAVETSWGAIGIFVCANGTVRECILPQLDHTPAVPFCINTCGSDAASQFLLALFSGKAAPCPALDPVGGTAFERAVWQAISNIPFGQVQRYADLARAVGRPRAVRAAANACGKNPIPLFIACHRVVGSGGLLGGFSSGLAWKRLLLSSEGLTGLASPHPLG